MAREFFTDTASTVLSKTLDAAAARQKAIANNIANVETPGYKRKYVTFETELRQALDLQGHSRREAMQKLTPLQQTDVVSPSRPDGNNVNIDAEISDLAKTTLTNKAATTLLEGKIAMLQTAITEGKR
ncbi:MAG: flagellar basal body rod protein FlgB [Armatimonadota bacterium]|nr:flagellar basal body rod protein FlgB [bacterium]